MSYAVIPLQNFMDTLGEDSVEKILSSFLCPRNLDIETFIRNKAFLSNKQRTSITHLVFEEKDRMRAPVGFFSLANKILNGAKENFPRKLWDRVKRFAILAGGRYQFASVLIAQLGKNYADGLDKRISGEELLGLAINEVRRAQMIVGGKTTYLECEDTPKLRAFYERNGFSYIGRRAAGDDDHSDLLLQYIRWVE